MENKTLEVRPEHKLVWTVPEFSGIVRCDPELINKEITENRLKIFKPFGYKGGWLITKRAVKQWHDTYDGLSGEAGKNITQLLYGL